MESAKLDGVFLDPIQTLNWRSPEQHLQNIAELGMSQIVFQWTSGHGRSLYPSSVYQQEWAVADGSDWLGRVMETCDVLGIKAWLGLDACRTIEEEHYDPVDASAKRACQTAAELAERYGHLDSLVGFYVPLELEDSPTSRTTDLLGRIAEECHKLQYPVLYSTRKPRLRPSGRHYEFLEQDQEWRAREDALFRRWATAWNRCSEATQLDILMLRDEGGVERHTPEAVTRDLQMLQDIKRLWVQVALYRVSGETPAHTQPTTQERVQAQLDAASKAEARIGFNYHHMDPQQGEASQVLYAFIGNGNVAPQRQPVSAPTVPAKRVSGDSLLAKADQVVQLVHEKCMLHDQIITVVDTRYPLEAKPNQWQEDTDWLTGLYVGAESFRYAVTGDPQAREHARASWKALHNLTHVSGVPGVVARHYRWEFEGDLGTGRKRWHRNPDGIYWIGDISRDQLSGHMFGLATYYDLVASEEERRVIRDDVEAITGLIVDNNMVAVDWDGEPCIHANFWVSPLFALSFLKSAYHITGNERYQQKYLELINPHYFLGHALRDATVCGNPFFQHYHHDSPLYHLLQYETDPQLLNTIQRCVDLLYEDTRRHGNAFFLLDHYTSHPESESGRKAVAELQEFHVPFLNVATWDRYARERLEDTDLHPSILHSLRYILEPDATLPGGKGHYLPLRVRPPKEFGWNYYTGEEARHSAGRAGHHGYHVQYSGIDYLLAYWMGRYHDVLS